MELDNVDVLLGMTIASIILGIGLSMFFIHPYTGYGAVVLAVGMMTLALMITARPRVIERVKREIVLQPSKQTEPTPITPPTFVIPSSTPSTEAVSEHAETEEEIAPTETKSEEPQTVEPAAPQPEKKEEELITTTPN